MGETPLGSPFLLSIPDQPQQRHYGRYLRRRDYKRSQGVVAGIETGMNLSDSEYLVGIDEAERSIALTVRLGYPEADSNVI